MKAILLTGTIKPEKIVFTILVDPVTRENQYKNSISFFLKTTTSPIIFTENSNCSENLKVYFQNEISSGRLEIISYKGLKFPASYGKGYGEMDIIDHTLKNSNILKNSTHVFKITGRYQLLNFRTLSKYALKANLDLFVRFKNNLTFCDSRFFYCSTNFLSNYLVKYKTKINDSKGIYFEHVLAKATHEAIIDGMKFSLLNTYPVFKGIYATTNTKYKTNWFYILPRKLLYIITFKLIQR